MEATKMSIEVIDIRKIYGCGNLRAFADVKFCGEFIVRGFSVIRNPELEGVFVSMPKKATPDGKWFDVFAPLNNAVRGEIEAAVIEAYDIA